MESLNEGVKIAPDAKIEIERIASQLGNSTSDVEQEIVQRLTRQHMGHTPVGDRSERIISRSDVIAYEVAGNIFQPKLFYYTTGYGTFRELETDEVEDEPRFDPAQEEHDADDGLEDLPAAEEDDDESAEESSETQEADDDLPVTAAQSLRQTHGALIDKAIRDKSGAAVPMQPIARLYHLMPRDAIIGHINDVWRTHGLPILKREIAASKAVDPTKIDASLVAFFDYLTRETCLTGDEINGIASEIKKSLQTAAAGVPSSADPAVIITSDVQKAVRAALANRSDKSNILEYLEKDTNRVTTREEDMIIAAPDQGVSRKTIRDISRKFSAILTTQNVPFKITPQNREMLDSLLTSRLGNVGVAEEEMIATAAYRDKDSAQLGASAAGTFAASANDLIATLSDNVDDERGKSEGSILPSVMLTRHFDIAGLQPHMRVSFKVRTGETAETIHNAISDLESFQRSNRTASAARMLDTPGNKINEELQAQISKLRSDSGQLNSGSTSADSARAVRDDLAFIAGLLDYLAMSGIDVLTPSQPDGTQWTASAAESRSSLLSLSRDVQGIALSMTDVIARAESAIQHARSRQIILEDIQRSANQLKKSEEIRRKMGAAEPYDAERALTKKIAALKAELEYSSSVAETYTSPEGEKTSVSVGMFSKIRRTMIDDIRAGIDQIDLNKMRDLANSHVKYTVVDEEAGKQPALREKNRQSSRYSINLAAERVNRIKRIDANVKGEFNKVARERGVLAVRDTASMASARYETQVARTVRGLAQRNGTHMHALTMSDTIDSICEQYGIGDAIKGSDLTRDSTGLAINCALPKKYDPSGAMRQYMVMSVESGDTSTERDPMVTLSYTIGVDAEPRTVEARRSDIIGSLATRGGSDEDKRRKAREDFAAGIRYAALRTYQQTGTAILTSPTEESAAIKSDIPFIPQLADLTYRNDVESGNSMIKSALGNINKAYDDVELEEPVDPDARVRANDRLVLALKQIAAVAWLTNRGEAMEDLIRRAYPDFTQTHNTIRMMLTSGRSAKGEIAELIDWAEQLQEHLENDSEELAHFEADLEAAIGHAAAGIDKISDAREARERGQYASQFVGIDIPVPGRGNLFVPGATVTVQDPKRTLNSIAIDNLNMLGIKPASMISAPLMATMSALQYATFKQVFIPVIAALSEDVADEFVDIIVGSYESSATDMQLAEITKLCEKGIRDIFIDPYTKGTEHGEDVDRSVVMRTYQRVTSILAPGRIASFDSPTMVSMDAETENVRSAIDDLYKILLDRVAEVLTSVEGARSLYTDAPCLASILSYGTFTQRERVYINALSPSSTEELTHMTASHFKDIMVGIAKSKSGTTALVSEQVDRVNSAVKVLNDFYASFNREAGRAATGEAESKTGSQVVVERLKRRAVKISRGDPAGVEATLRTMLGLDPGANDAQVLAAAGKIASRIDQEMSLLSDTSSKRGAESRIEAKFSQIINAHIGPRANIDMILTKLNVPDSGKTAPYNAALNALRRWIKTTPRVTHVDEEQTARRPDETVRFGVQQMIEDISNRVFKDIVEPYRASSERVTRLYTRTPTATPAGAGREKT